MTSWIIDPIQWSMIHVQWIIDPIRGQTKKSRYIWLHESLIIAPESARIDLRGEKLEEFGSPAATKCLSAIHCHIDWRSARSKPQRRLVFFRHMWDFGSCPMQGRNYVYCPDLPTVDNKTETSAIKTRTKSILREQREELSVLLCKQTWSFFARVLQ